MSMKNKQYKIEKGLMLFTQPRSPFFYGKIRLNRKYVTKSFAPITDLDEAKVMLFDWQKELLSQNTIPLSAGSSADNFKSRSEYVEHVPIENDFQFLEVGRFDPNKKNTSNTFNKENENSMGKDKEKEREKEEEQEKEKEKENDK